MCDHDRQRFYHALTLTVFILESIKISISLKLTQSRLYFFSWKALKNHEFLYAQCNKVYVLHLDTSR